MSHRFSALAVVLGAIVVTASATAIYVGVTDSMLAGSGPRRTMLVEKLGEKPLGWFLLDACVRHDLAVVVTVEGTAYKLGEPGVETDDTDRIFTPLSAHDDCSDERPPKKVYALVEDADAVNTTLQRGGTERIAPPPIVAMVEGTAGPRAADTSLGKRAARKLAAELPGVEGVPLLKKDGHPGPRWVALLTILAGMHGFLLLVVGGLYLRRRAARRDNLRSGVLDDAEERFFETETLD